MNPKSELWSYENKALVLVLSVRRFKSRHQSVRQQLDSLGIPFEFVFRFDDPDSEAQNLVRFKPVENIRASDRSIASKHAEAWRIARQSGHSHLLVLEDDFVLRPNFFEQFDAVYRELVALPAGHLINLGGANSKVPLNLYRSSTFFYPHWMETCEGYLCDQTALGKLLSWLDANLVDRPSDHMIRKASQEVGVQHYWPKDALLEQGSLYGLFPSELDSVRSKTLSVSLRLMYESKKFRRRTLRKWFAAIFSGR